jgi:hypothetical protein
MIHAFHSSHDSEVEINLTVAVGDFGSDRSSDLQGDAGSQLAGQ